MIEEIARQLRKLLNGRHPRIAIILGSGLGSLGEEISDPLVIPYSEINNFPQSTVSGHSGKLICGKLEGLEVLCLQGRFHLYEGHTPQTVNLVIKVLAALGIKELIVTNASGSLHKNFAPGTLMLISDHINLSGTNPLIGPNDETFGPRFPDMSNAYDIQLREQLKTIAKQENIPLSEGVYLMITGPSFDTAAEVKAYHILGADAVGMSTVPEVICAVHSGIKVLGISVITNFGTGLREGVQSHTETLEQGNKAAIALTRLIKAYLKEKQS